MHKCVFDSKYGLSPTKYGPALMCRCGVWLIPNAPSEAHRDLPRDCVKLTWLASLIPVLRGTAIALGIALLLVWLFR